MMKAPRPSTAFIVCYIVTTLVVVFTLAFVFTEQMKALGYVGQFLVGCLLVVPWIVADVIRCKRAGYF